MAMAIVNYIFFSKRIGKETALLASIFLVTSVDLLFFFSFQGEIDLFYSLIVFFQVLTIIKFSAERKLWVMYLLSYLFMAIGFLTKGLPSIAFQGITLLGVLLYEKQTRKLFSLSHVVGGVIGFGLIASYFWAYSQKADVWLYLGRLLTESTRRTVSTGNSWGFLLLFPVSLLKITAPWCLMPLFYFRKIANAIRERNRWIVVTSVFVGSNIIIYWLSPGTRDRYLYMFLPFIFNLLAFLITPFVGTNRGLKTFVSSITAVALLALMIFGIDSFGHNISHKWIRIVATVIPLAGVLLGLLRGKITPVFGLILLLLCIRFGFDLIITEVRKQEDFQDQLREKASRLEEIGAEESIYYYVPYEEVNSSFPIIEKALAYQEVERLPYAISFHYTALTNQLIKHQPILKSGQLYIAQQKYVRENSITVLENFSVSKGRNYVVFRKK